MKSALILLAACASSVTALLPAYAQCGGLWFTLDWQCEVGTTCSPVGDDAFPNFQCLPNTGPIIPHVFPYNQCGGDGFNRDVLCPPYWTCFKHNQWIHSCVKEVGYVAPPLNVTPEIASPGAFCGKSAFDRSQAAVCAPGYVCTGPGVFGYFVCKLDKTITPPKVTTTGTISVTTTLITTTKRATSAKTTTTKKATTIKKTTSSKRPVFTDI